MRLRSLFSARPVERMVGEWGEGRDISVTEIRSDSIRTAEREREQAKMKREREKALIEQL